MKTLPRALALLSISIIAPCTASCSPQPKYIKATSSVFDDASPLLNTNVQARGLLRWTFENRNLFPPEASADHVSAKTCLPVLIPSNNNALIELAKKMDGHIVTVSGRIVQVAPQGKVSVTTCKQQGIEVNSIN
jgi:hypothetical protein